MLNRWTKAQTELAERVAEVCRSEMPPETRHRVSSGLPLEKSHYIEWQKILQSHGFMTGHWPLEQGGYAWTAREVYTFYYELYKNGAPWLLPFGVNYVGPVIYTFGSDEQKQQYLPSIANSDVFWCQGFSEPGAGSDLASLRTSARRNGDNYLVNGSKIWTTMAHWADMMFCLVRTDSSSKPQAGISFLLIDMKSPGISIRPIETIDRHHHVNEVFFDNVEVPIFNLIGEENRGWTYAKFLLTNERYLAADIGKIRRFIERIEALRAPERQSDHDLDVRLRQLDGDALALEWMALRMLEAEENGNQGDAAETSILKLRGAELVQQASELAVDALGMAALRSGADPDDALQGLDWANGQAFEYLYNRAPTIWGGSNEIQRNIIAKQVLGL